MTDIKTLREQVDTIISLFEDVSETLGRVEETVESIETKLGTDTDQGVSSRKPSERVDLSSVQKALQAIPNLAGQIETLQTSLDVLQEKVPELTSMADTLLESQENLEAAGKFSRSFQEPMSELLGRKPDGTYDEGKFVLRNLAHAFFKLLGRDDLGRPKETAGDKFDGFFDHYFTKHYLDAHGHKRPRGSVIFESLLDYFINNAWHRVFDCIIWVLLYWVFIAPAVATVRSIQVISPAAQVISPAAAIESGGKK